MSIQDISDGRDDIVPGSATTERGRFVAAFEAIIARGEYPSPGALNREQGFDTRRAIPGRLSGLRQEMLLDAGYVFDNKTRRWKWSIT